MRNATKVLLVLVFFVIVLSPSLLLMSQTSDPMPQCVGDILGADAPSTLVEATTAIQQVREARRGAGDRAGEADALYCWGLVYFAQGNYPALQQPFRDARTQFERALLAYRETANRAGEARALHQFGRTYFVLRDFGNTLPNYQQALRTAQAVSDLAVQADVRFDLGVFFRELGNPSRDLDESETQFLEAYSAYFQLQNDDRLAETLMLLGQTQFDLWQLETAAASFGDAADLYQELGNTDRQAEALYGAARILHHTGSLYAAEEAYNEVLALYQEVGNRAGEGRVISALGNIYYQMGYSIAQETLEDALRINRDAGDNVGRSITLSYLGDVLLANGNTSEALSSLESALELAETANDIAAGALAYLGRGRVNAELARTGRQPLQPALNDFGEASRRYRDMLGDLYSLRRVFVSEGWARYNINANDQTAYNLFFEAVNKARQVGDKRGEADSLHVLGQVFARNLDYNQAVTFLTQGAEVAEETDDPILIGDINAALGDVFVLRAQLLVAQERFETALINYEDADEEVKAALMNSRLGQIEQRFGNYRSAIDNYRSVLDTLEFYDNPRRNQPLIDQTLASTNLRLGIVYLDVNLYDRAETQLTQARQQLEDINDNFSVATALVALGDLEFARQDYGGANDLYRRAARQGEQINNQRAQALALSGIGATMVAMESAEFLEIQENFEGALDLIRRILDQEGEYRILMRMAEAEVMRKEYGDAVNYFSAARRVAGSINDRRGAAYATVRLGFVYSFDATDRQSIGATRTFTEAAQAYRAIPDPAGEALALAGLGDIALRRSQFNDAINHFTQMQIAYENARDPVGRATAHTRLGLTYEGQRRYELAAKEYSAAETVLDMEIDFMDDLRDERRENIARGELLRAVGDLQRTRRQIADAQQSLEDSVRILSNGALLAQDQHSLALYTLGSLLLQQGDINGARDQFERARDIAQRIEDEYAFGLAQYGLARVLTEDGDPTNAPEENRLYNLALDTFRVRVPNPLIAREILISRADSFRRIGDYEEARNWYLTARNEAREASDPIGEGYALLELGDLRLERFLFDEALADYNEAATQFRRGDDWIGRGETLYRLAEIHMQMVDFPLAFERYQEALALYESEESEIYGAQGDLLRQAETLTRIGEAYQRQARLALALNQQFQAVSRIEAAKDALSATGELIPDDIVMLTGPVEARIYRNLGAVRIEMGQLDDARDSLARALELARESQDRFELASVRQMSGRVDFLDHFYQRAIDRYSEAAAEFALVNQPLLRGELMLDVADACYNLAIETRNSGNVLPEPELTDADFTFEETAEALTVERLCAPESDTASAWLDMVSEARIAYQRALDVARNLDNTVLEIRAQQGLGRVFNWLGDNEQASEYLVAALEGAEEIELLPLRASILVDLGLLAEERADRGLATRYYTEAVELFEDVYADIRLEPGQIAFASQNILPYHRLVSLYMDSDPAQALAYAERGRARSLLYQIGTEQIDFGVSATGDLMAEWQASRQLIREMYSQYQSNLTARESEADSSERNRLLDENRALIRQITQIEESLDDLRERIDTQSAVLSQVTEVNPRSLDDIQANLAAEATIVSYYIVPPSTVSTSGRVYTFTISPNSFETTALEVEPETLDTAVDSLLGARDLETLSDTFVDLYGHLIDPIHDQLSGAQVVIVPHGVLNTVPFGALTADGQNFFGDERQLVYASSATLYSLLREDRQETLGDIRGSAVVFGNPTTYATVPGTDGTRSELSDLFQAEAEAEQIARLLSVEPRTRELATESTLWRDAQASRLIHIAAHGVFNPSNPLATFLALASDESNDGNLQVREIYSLSLEETEPLVVLSACDTALGGISQSDDVQSLSRAFLISGARSVVATLWKVDDEATQALMTRFYENLVNDQMSVAAALSDAQAYIRSQPEWSAPSYWAAFVLIGLPT